MVLAIPTEAFAATERKLSICALPPPAGGNFFVLFSKACFLGLAIKAEGEFQLVLLGTRLTAQDVGTRPRRWPAR